MKLINYSKIFFIVILVSAVTVAQEKYGKDLTLEGKTEISEIIKSPSEYLGKRVLVEGEILSVCQKAGCWMEISNESGEKIRVKVKDGEIVFPQEGVGKNALVEGEVYKIELSEEEAIGYFEHMAEESSQEFDPSTVTGPVTIYQIKGFGAVIN